MNFRLFDAPATEPSQIVGFAGNILDRQSENRSDDSALRALDDPGRACCCSAADAALLKVAGDAFDGRFTREESEAFGAAADQAILLGFSPTARCWQRPYRSTRRRCPIRSRRSTTGRSTCRACSTPPRSARWRRRPALLAWHASHRFCGKCGQPTRNARRRLQARLHGLRHRAFSAHRPGGDHADRGAGQMPPRTQQAFRAGHVFRARRLHRARRDDRERGAARDAGGSRHPAWPRRLSRQPALAVPLFADDRLLRRGAERGHRRRPRGTRGLPLVFARGGARPCSTGPIPTHFVPPKGAIAYHLIRDWAESA